MVHLKEKKIIRKDVSDPVQNSFFFLISTHFQWDNNMRLGNARPY